MSWSEIYSRSNDPISDSIADLKTRANMAEAIEEQITISDRISPVRVLVSRLRVTDIDMFSAYARIRSAEARYYLPFEPDGVKVRLDLKFDHGGEELTDYSYMDNECVIGYDYQQPTLRKRAEDDETTAGKICSIYDGIQHHVKVTNSEAVSLKTMNELDGETGFFFVKRISFLTLQSEFRSSNTKRATIAYFIENEAVEYAVKVEVDDSGRLFFFVRCKLQDYWLSTTGPVVDLPTEVPNFFSENFNEQDFDADTSQFLSIFPVPFADFAFTFNFQTKKMQIFKNGVLVTESSNTRSNSAYMSGIYTTGTAVPAQSADLSLWLPLTEGIGTTKKLIDISGKNNHSNIIDSTRPPTHVISNTNRRALEFGEDGDYIPVPKSTSLNTLTSFTVAFFAYLHSDYYSIAHSKILFAFADSGNGRFTVYSPSGTSRDIRIDITNNAGTTRFLNLGANMLPASGGSLAHIVITYDGTTYKAYVNTVIGSSPQTFAGDLFTNSGDMIIGSPFVNSGGHVNLNHVMFWKNKALTQFEINELYNTLVQNVLAINNTANLLKPSNQPIFPPGKDEPDPPPEVGEPIQTPFTEVMSMQTQNSQVKINKVTTSNLTKFYDVAGGTPVSDPQVAFYDVDPGTGSNTTAPFSEVYNLAGASSTGQIDDDQGETAMGQYITDNQSTLYNKQITEIQVWLNGLGNPSGGQVWLGIIKANGSTISFGTSIDPSSIPDDWTSYTKQNTANTYAMQVGDAVGVFWTSPGSGKVNIRRGGSGVHEDTEDPDDDGLAEYSCQNKYDPGGGGWGTPNEDFSIAGVFKTGGGTIISSPYVSLSSNSGQRFICAEYAPTGSAMIGKVFTKAEFRVYRENVSANGTVSIRHIKPDSNYWETLMVMNVADLPTTEPATFNFVWNNVAYARAISAGERFGVVVSSSTGAKVFVLANTKPSGPLDDYDTNKTYLVQRSVGSGIWNTSPTADMSGKIYTGGNDFTGYTALDNNRKRLGVKANAADSVMVNKVITSVKITAKKINNPAAGAIYCRLRSDSGGLKATIGQRDISEVLGTDTVLEFTNVDNITPMLSGDHISIEYDNGTATDYIDIRVAKNVIDTTKTIMVQAFLATIDVEEVMDDRDLAGEMYTGGTIDTSARPMRGMRVKAGSALIGKAITEARILLKRTGTFGAGENMSVKIIRDLDKVVASTLDTREINTISSSAFTEYIFQEVGNAYSLAEGDFIGVECNFGNSTDHFIELAINDTDVYDTTKTIMFNYNGTTYSDDVSFDMVAKLYTGGNIIFPDPDIPVEPDPYHYFHGWIIGAAAPLDSNAEAKPETLMPETDTYVNAFVDQFRIYSMLPTNIQLLNYFNNRFTITGITKGQVEVIGHDISGYDSS